MPGWTRNTPWRQGHLLTDEAVRAFELIRRENTDDTVVIVASHSCDLAQPPEKEPHVEVIVGSRIKKLDGNNTHANSSRTLHIGFEGNEPLLAQFVITEKQAILKKLLADFKPDTDRRLTPKSLATFQIWLASRYRRSAFPNEFESRLTASRLNDKIAKAVRPHGEMITAIFFDVDDGQELSRTGEDDVYVLDIYLLHAAEPDFNTAELAATEAKEKIENAFHSKLFDNQSGDWQGIELRYVEVISEDAMTYRQSKYLKKWRLDYISLGADPQQPVLAE